jgi:protein-S-isoprenylcysteine O-methyltransferase Ste14
MTIYSGLIFALWLTLVAYWVLASRARKASFGGQWMWWREVAVRLGLFALVMLTLQVAAERHALPNAPACALSTSPLPGLVGCVLCLLGIGLAVLARAHLESSGVTAGSDRRTVGLVTTGPYALVRHPLYSGLLLAVLGSAIGQSVLWLLPLIVYGPLFIVSARREENRLLEQFPESYPAYMKRTKKMLLPFVL